MRKALATRGGGRSRTVRGGRRAASRGNQRAVEALRFAAVLCCVSLGQWPALAAPFKTAVFPFELIDTSHEGEFNGIRADETRRLELISEELRILLRQDGRYASVAISGLGTEIEEASPLHKCNRCARDLARKAGADLAMTGTVQKVSNLILNINIYVLDVASGKIERQMSADIRGNTDESWTRGLRWLVRNRLFASEGGEQ